MNRQAITSAGTGTIPNTLFQSQPNGSLRKLIEELFVITCARPRTRLNEPKVTINGANLNRAIKTPCNQPIPVATSRPIKAAIQGLNGPNTPLIAVVVR